MIASCIQIVLAANFYPNSNFQNWSRNSIFAVIYLAVFGSVIALFCYQYALKKVAPIKVSILTYVNKIIEVMFKFRYLDQAKTIHVCLEEFIWELSIPAVLLERKLNMNLFSYGAFGITFKVYV